MSNEIATITKYTGQTVDQDRLFDSAQSEDKTPESGLALRIAQNVWELQSTDRRLSDAVVRLRRAADQIESNLNAGPNDNVYTLNSLGVLQGTGSEVDVLVATRASHINNLRSLVALWVENYS